MGDWLKTAYSLIGAEWGPDAFQRIWVELHISIHKAEDCQWALPVPRLRAAEGA